MKPTRDRLFQRLLFIFGPGLLMVGMGMTQVYILPFVVQRPWSLQPVWMILSVLCVGAYSLLWRRALSGNWFFFWGSLLAILAVLVTYLGVSLSGLIFMGGHDEFPGAIIMLPTIALLLCICFIALMMSLMVRWRKKL